MTPEIRSPRHATHAHRFGEYGEYFYSRRGCLVYEFSPSRNEWFLSKREPRHLAGSRPLNIFEMHPETAMERLAY